MHCLYIKLATVYWYMYFWPQF